MKDLIKAAKDIMKQMEGLEESSSRQSEAFNNHFRQTISIMDDYAKQMTESSKTIMGASRSYEEMEKSQKKISARQKKYYDEVVKIEKKIRKIRNEGTEDGIQLDAAAAEKRIEQLNYEMTLQMKHAKRIHEFEAGLLQQRATEREDRYKEFQSLLKDDKKNMEKMRAFGKDMGGLAKGGDLGGMGKGMADGMAGILKQLSGVGGKLGAVAGALSVTVGLLGALVALMFEADKAAKDMNKSFLNGASGLDMMGTSFKRGQLTERLAEMRDMAYSVGMQFRMSASDVAALSSQFNTMGLKYEEMARMSGEDDPVKGLRRNLEQAIVSSKMLGVEANTVAEQIAQMNENFAMDLSQINEAFQAIYMSAQTTGIATQKFFAMVTQVTGGMSLLNVDFAQTAAIAGELVESLGEAAGSSFLSDLANRGASKSYQDRFKSALLSGGKTSRISRKGVEARASRLQESDAFKQLTRSDAFQNALSSLGIDNFDNSDIMGSFNKMTMEQQRNLIASTGNTAIGGSAEIERQMRALQQLNISSKQGGVTGAAVQMGQFNTGENLAQFLAEAGAFADLSKGQSLGGMSRAVLEQISGKSGMEVDQLVTMVDKMNSNMSVVRTYADQISSGEKSLSEIAAENNMNAGEFQKMLQEQYKLTIDAEGKVKSSITGTEVKNLEDYMINMGDSMKDSVTKAMSFQDTMAQETVKNTASMSVIMENVIGKLLNEIAGWVESIASWLFREDPTEADKQDKMSRINRELDDDYSTKIQLEELLNQFAGKNELTESEKEEKARLEASLTELDKQMRFKQESLRIYASTQGTSGESEIYEARNKIFGDGRAEVALSKQEQAFEYMEALDDFLISQPQLDGYDYVPMNQLAEGDMRQAMFQPLYDKGLTKDEISGFAQQYYDEEQFGDAVDTRTEAEKYKDGDRWLLTSAVANAVDSDWQDMLQHDLEIMGSFRGYDLEKLKDPDSKLATFIGENRPRDTKTKKVFDPYRDSQDAVGDTLSYYKETTEEQRAMKKQAEASNVNLDTLVDNFKTLGADTEDMRSFQEKKLSPAIGKEVMKAMVAEKLFDVAGASGMSLTDILEAQKTQNDGISGNDVLIGRKIDAEIAKLNATTDADRIAELEKQKANLKTLGLKDAAYIDGVMYPQGEGAIITTPDGTSYQTKGDDNMLIGTNVGKGGGSAAGQTVIMNVDKVVTTARNGAELADSLMKEMKRNPNTKKRIRRSRN